jgi:hypothetical protein
MILLLVLNIACNKIDKEIFSEGSTTKYKKGRKKKQGKERKKKEKRKVGEKETYKC